MKQVSPPPVHSNTTEPSRAARKSLSCRVSASSVASILEAIISQSFPPTPQLSNPPPYTTPLIINNPPPLYALTTCFTASFASATSPLACASSSFCELRHIKMRETWTMPTRPRKKLTAARLSLVYKSAPPLHYYHGRRGGKWGKTYR